MGDEPKVGCAMPTGKLVGEEGTEEKETKKNTGSPKGGSND